MSGASQRRVGESESLSSLCSRGSAALCPSSAKEARRTYEAGRVSCLLAGSFPSAVAALLLAGTYSKIVHRDIKFDGQATPLVIHECRAVAALRSGAAVRQTEAWEEAPPTALRRDCLLSCASGEGLSFSSLWTAAKTRRWRRRTTTEHSD